MTCPRAPQERTGALRVGGETPLAGDGKKGRQASAVGPIFPAHQARVLSAFRRRL